MRALLDVNVLIALHDPLHIHHAHAANWLEAHADAGWATCPLTQNGCLRVMSQASYSHPRTLAELMPALATSCTSRLHAFWPDDISLLDAGRLTPDRVHGHRQLTDLYLLALAVHHRGRFVSFDARVPLDAVAGARRAHMVTLLSV